MYNLKFENLTIFKDVIYVVKNGKIESFNTSGKRVYNDNLNSLDNVNYIGFFDDENFVTHSKNKELNFYYKNKILEKKTNVKKILFVDEKFDVSSLKKYISSSEFNYIKDLLKTSDLKKKILVFEVNSRKKIILIDRFVDSTLAYQVYGKKVSKQFIHHIHKFILKNIKPDLNFVLKVNVNSASKRLKKRRVKNRYDKFPQAFYTKAQKHVDRRNRVHLSTFGCLSFLPQSVVFSTRTELSDKQAYINTNKITNREFLEH